MNWGMKLFYAQGFEIAECELRDAGLPITQDGADKFATIQWRGSKSARLNRKLDACYRRGKYSK